MKAPSRRRGRWGWYYQWGVNGHQAEPLPGGPGAKFMIVSANGRYLPKTAHDHETAPPGVAWIRRAWPVAWMGPSAKGMKQESPRVRSSS